MSVNLGEARGRITIDADNFNRGLTNAANQLGRFSQRSQIVGYGLSQLSRTFAVAGGVMAGALVGAVKLAADFDEQMRNVGSISDEVNDNLKGFSDRVLEISSINAKAPTDIAAALYQVVSAGIPAGKALDIVNVSAKAATAGLTTTATAATAITAVLNAGMKNAEGQFVTAAQAGDYLFRIVDRGVLTFGQLADQIGDNTALAAQLGLTIEDLGAGYITLTQIGVKAAEAPTQINAILSSLLKPSEEFTGQLATMGLTADDLIASLSKEGGLANVLAVVNELTKGSAAEIDKVSGNIRAIRGYLGLATDAGERFAEAQRLMADSAGSLDRVLERQRKSLSFAVKDLVNSIKILGTQIGGDLAPIVSAIARGLREFVGFLNNIPDPIRKVFVGIAALTSGMLLLGAAGAALTSRIITIGAALRVLASEGALVVQPFRLLLSPVSAVTGLFFRFGGIIATLFSPLRLLGAALNLVLSPLRLFGVGFGLLGLIFGRLLAPFRALGVGLTAIRIAFGGALPLLARFRIAFAGIGIIISAILSPITAVISLISGIGGAILGVIGLLATFAGVALAVAVAFGTWKIIEDSVRNVYDQIKNLLGLGEEVKDFFDTSEETKQTDKNVGKTFDTVTRLRDAIAKALGDDKKKPIGVPGKGGPGGAGRDFFSQAKKQGNTGFLKDLRKQLNTSGREIRAWSNKMKIGGRAVGDFFDIVGGAGGLDKLKKFRARLNDIFGPEVGGLLYQGTKNLRESVRGMADSLSQLLGFGDKASMEGFVLGSISALNRFSKFAREQFVPAIGTILAELLDLGAGFADLGAAILSGDFQGALDAVAAIVKETIEGVAIPIGTITLRVLGWAWDGIVGLYDKLKTTIMNALTGSGGGGTFNTLDEESGAGGGDISYPIGTVALTIGGWLLKGGEGLLGQLRAKVIEWAFGGNGSSSITGGMSGTGGSAMTGTGQGTHDLGDVFGVITARVGGWLLEQTESLAGALGKKITSEWLPAARDEAIKAVSIAAKFTLKLPGFLVDIGRPAFHELFVLGTELVNWATPKIASLAGMVVGTVASLAVDVGSWIVGKASALGGQLGSAISAAGSGAAGLLGSIYTYVSGQIASIPVGQIWGSIGELAVGVGGWAIGTAGALGGKLGAAIQSAASGVSGLYGTVSTFVTDQISSIPTDQIWGALTDLKVAIEGFLPEVKEGATSLVDAVTKFITDIWNDFTSKSYPLQGRVILDASGVEFKVTGGETPGPGSADDRIANAMFGGEEGSSLNERIQHSIEDFLFHDPIVLDEGKVSTYEKGLEDTIALTVEGVVAGAAIGAAGLIGLGIKSFPALLQVTDATVEAITFGLLRGFDKDFRRGAAAADKWFQPIQDSLRKSIGKFLFGEGTFLNDAGELTTAIVEMMPDINIDFGALINKILEPKKSSAEKMFGVDLPGGELLSSFGKKIKDNVVTPIVNGIKGVPDLVLGELGKIPNPFGAIRDGISGLMSEAFSKFGPQQAKTGIVDEMGDTISVDDGLAGEFVNPIIELISDVPTAFTNAFAGMTNPFDVISTQLSTWKNAIHWPDPPEVPEWIKDPIGWVKGQLGIAQAKTKVGDEVPPGRTNMFGGPAPAWKKPPKGTPGGDWIDTTEGGDQGPIDVEQSFNVSSKFSFVTASGGAVANVQAAIADFIKSEGLGGDVKATPAPVDVPIDPKFTMKEGTTPDISTLFTTFKPTGDGTEEAGGDAGIPVDITIAPTFKLAEGTSIGDLINQLLGGGGGAEGAEGGGEGGGANAMGASIVNALVAGMTAALPMVTTAVTAITTAIFTTLQTFLATSTALGTETGDNYGAGVSSQSGAVSAAASTLTQAIFDIIQGFLGTATDIGSETGGNYASGVESQSGAASSAGSALMSAALGAIEGGYNAAFNAGFNIGNGMAAGILSQVGAVASAAAALSAAAVVTTSKALQTASPSKVFRKIGLFVGQGFAYGMDDTQRLVEASAKALVNAPSSEVPRSPVVVGRTSIERRRPVQASGHTFHGVTFVMPNLDTAQAVEQYLATMG